MAQKKTTTIKTQTLTTKVTMPDGDVQESTSVMKIHREIIVEVDMTGGKFVLVVSGR